VIASAFDEKQLLKVHGGTPPASAIADRVITVLDAGQSTSMLSACRLFHVLHSRCPFSINLRHV
jgi:hypothetical protein